MKTFHLEIAAPDGLRYDGDAVQLSVRGTEGELAILFGHIPLVTALKAGECRVYVGDAVRRAKYSGGILTVTKETVRMLSAEFRWLE
ncbi:MAG: F0F1 ATP synthase subunit epsilon [Clostridia bacterium]|nr:F0F1 ATP synthase subunit epsilon [Clostridia bacterium]